MDPLDNLKKLSQPEIVARWGLSGTVKEAYEKEVGLYKVMVLLTIDCWSAYWSYEGSSTSCTHWGTKEEALHSLIERSKELQKELEGKEAHLREIESLLNVRDGKPALTRLDDELI